jgi:hypothetical protein
MKVLLIITLSIITLTASSFNINGGDVIGKNIYGVINDIKGNPIQIDGKAVIVKDNSYSGFLNIKDKEEDISQDFLISSFSSSNGIGSLYVTKTKMDENGIKAIDTKSIDLSALGGVYSPSKGYKTSWNTYLFSQDKLIDSKNDKEFIQNFKPYFTHKSKLVNSYKYGWGFEAVVLNIKGDAKAINNYAMGRTFASDIAVMPDNRTVYIYDGKYSKNLYLFIADKAQDFIKGMLYVAKFDGDKMKFEKLGKNSSLKMKLKMRRGVAFKNIYKSKKAKNGKCARKYTFISTVYGDECLRVNKRFKKYAGVFEPIRQSAVLGVEPFLTDTSSMSYESDSNMLVFKNGDSIIHRYQTNNKDLKSEFIIK